MARVDLNSDLGESFGRYSLGLDDQVIPLVTSVNIACGMHAGDPCVMHRTVAAAAAAATWRFPPMKPTHSCCIKSRRLPDSAKRKALRSPT